MSSERGATLFWLLLALAVSVGAYGLGLGDVRAPGSGFLPFWAAVLLGVLSLVRLIQTSQKRRLLGEPVSFGRLWGRVLLVFLALLGYAKLLPVAGYNITTFLLMTFVFWVAGRQAVWRVVTYALSTTVITFIVFSKWLNCQFPLGPFGF